MWDWLNETYTFRELFFGKKPHYGKGGSIEPKILYHGTDKKLNSLIRQQDDIGIHLGTKGQADYRANKKEGNINIYKILNTIKNPIEVRDIIDWHDESSGDLIRELIKTGKFNKEELDALETMSEVREAIKSKGYDGIKYINEFEYPGLDKLEKKYGIEWANLIIRKPKEMVDFVKNSPKEYSYISFDESISTNNPDIRYGEGGVINETNYFENTEGDFYIIQPSEYNRIDTKEYVSAFGSRYKVKDGILYRSANHWGKMNSVKWNLKDKHKISVLFDKELDTNLEGYTQDIYGKIPFSEMKTIGKQLIIVEPQIRELIQKLNKEGHQALIIGGAVRDALLGIEPKDIDIEVYKISYNDLMTFLSNYGKVDLVGKKFGVVKFKPKDSEWTYDFSIPRKENKIGIGHTEFEIIFDKDMTIEEASARRDLTINAIGYDPIENKIYDSFGGVEHLKNKVIKHTSKQFSEDSLRILRILQFQSRFNFTIHYDTIQLIREMLKTNEFDNLSKERVYEEWRKWAEKGVRHDLIFKFLRDTTLIEKYPELKLLKETPQDKIYHPEGDVEIHTEMTLTEMDKIVEKENISGEEKVILIMSILFHDIAKPQTTKEEFKRARMTITSHGHEALGGEMVKEILPRLGFPESLITPISNLVANHLSGVSISMIDSRSGKMKAVKKLSRRLYPATIQQLLYVMDADNYGRGGERKEATGKAELIELSAEADVQNKAYQPILMGRHLIEKGLMPSPKFKEILQKSFEAQESGAFNDLTGAKKWLEDYLNTNN